MSVSPSQVFAYLIQKHGVSAESAMGILANIKYESSFNPSAVGDGGTSGGLFQHHLGRWDNLKSYASQTGRSWDDWTAQVDFAIKEAKGMGINLQATSAYAASKEWTLRFERPADAARKAEQRAATVGEYSNLDPNANYTVPGSSTPSNPGSGNAMPSETQEQLNIPQGGSWWQGKDGDYYVAFRFYGTDDQSGPSQVVYYQAQGPPPSGTRLHHSGRMDEYSAGWVSGGTVDSFRGVPPGKSYQDLVDDTLLQLGLAGSDALQDAGVMAIIALAMTRELSEAELSNRLRKTDWFQSRTDAEREWDDLSQAEKEQRLVDQASQLASTWFTYVGEDLQIADYDTNGDGNISAAELKAGNGDLYTWAEKVASGKASQVTAVNQWMKDVALDNPESPWARTVREEEANQGQFAVDVSNTAGQVKDLYSQWGVDISDKQAQQFANQVVMNKMSIEDVEQDLKDQANALYPHKPPDMTTRDYAKPFMSTYMQTLETGEPDLQDSYIQEALSEGANLTDFRKRLRQDDRWLETDNARNEMNTKVSQLGQVMGF